jgi:hypothetical protein
MEIELRIKKVKRYEHRKIYYPPKGRDSGDLFPTISFHYGRRREKPNSPG